MQIKQFVLEQSGAIEGNDFCRGLESESESEFDLTGCFLFVNKLCCSNFSLLNHMFSNMFKIFPFRRGEIMLDCGGPLREASKHIVNSSDRYD